MSQLIANQVDLSQSDTKESYVLYKYRYIIGLLYILLSNNNMLMWCVFSPIQTTISTVYDQSITFTNFCTILISNVSYIPANFIGNYVIDTFGLRIGLFTGSILTVAGLWVRCLSKHNFIWIFIGQILAGFAQPYFYTTPTKISNMWFGVNERTNATTILSISLNIGITLGNFLPQFFVDINADPDTILNQIQNMMLWGAIFGSACLVLMILFMKEKPPTPPSKAATAEKHSSWKSLKVLIKDRNTIWLIISTAIIAGSLVNYFATLQQAVQPYNIDGDQSGNILSISNVCSMFGAIGVAAVFNKYKRFNLFLIVLSTSSFVILIANLFAAESGNVYLLGTSVVIYSILVAPVTPIALEYGVELSFPVTEATVGGLWYAVLETSSIIQSLIVDEILTKYPTQNGARLTFIIVIVYQLFGTIPLFFVKENLKRAKYEKQGLLSKVVDENCIEKSDEYTH